jgi:hypothetical protein
MIWYIYWYFVFHGIYKRFSIDSQFDIFAASMFSIFVTSIIIGTLGICFMFFFNLKDFFFDREIYFYITAILVLLMNYFIFIPKKRQIILYNIYREKQSTTRDIVSIALSIFSVAIMITYGVIAHRYFKSH